jgi:hypothetical protein
MYDDPWGLHDIAALVALQEPADLLFISTRLFNIAEKLDWLPMRPLFFKMNRLRLLSLMGMFLPGVDLELF